VGNRWLIAGLGNPGSQYQRTRHNAGFWFVDELDRIEALNLRPNRKLHGLAAKTRWADTDCVFLCPDTFMNESGRAVRATADYYNIATENILVAYDELDLPPGTARFKQVGGHGGHNGMRSIFAHLDSHNFWRLRIGIGHPGIREAVTPWVLSRASQLQEQAIIDAIQRAAGALPSLLQGQPGEAMKQLHTAV